MGKYVLIACCSEKLTQKAFASGLYISDLFKKSMAYAKSINPEKIFILSAKYGLLELQDEINPYDETLNTKPADEVKLWASNVLKKLSQKTDLENDEFIFLAGNKYRKYLIPKIKNYKIPLEGLGIGKQKKWLKDIINGKLL